MLYVCQSDLFRALSLSLYMHILYLCLSSLLRAGPFLCYDMPRWPEGTLETVRKQPTVTQKWVTPRV